LNVNFPTFLAK